LKRAGRLSWPEAEANAEEIVSAFCFTTLPAPILKATSRQRGAARTLLLGLPNGEPWIPDYYCEEQAPVAGNVWGEKAALAVARKLYGRTFLGSLLGGPISQSQELPYLAAFVAIFLGFGRSVVGLAEGMFGIADSFLNQVQRLCHTLSFITRRLCR